MSVNAGARLDRLPMSRFHRRIFWLIGIGMFFDGFDIYVASTVIGAIVASHFATLAETAQFVSMTFVGMTIGSLGTGFLGDRFGRRFTYQANLMIFGLASLAAAVAPNMGFLIACRFMMGVGLGAENVVGYSTLTEFMPPAVRGRMQGLMTVFVVTGLPVSSLIGIVLVPAAGWRLMFVLGGLGAIAVWYVRKQLPESPRWLAATGRDADAEALLASIEAEVAADRGPLPAIPDGPAPRFSRSIDSLFAPGMLRRMVVGCVLLIVINTLIYGFITWLPTFFIKQGMTIVKSFGFALVMSLGAPVGSAIGALTADRWGRRRMIVIASALAIAVGAIYPFVSDPALLMVCGVALVVPIYILVALLFGIYVPELFPTEVRLRASGICNTLGRAATIGTPFLVVTLFGSHGVAGVLALMIALLVLQIVMVVGWGVETRGRTLEDVAADVVRSPLPVATDVSTRL
ncbi:MAG TPA: MFS transporter [Kofleriaceae bacterium]|jgi:putative MFS transporter|nr:MFS transporter [Kofleriaceae bacterium]